MGKKLTKVERSNKAHERLKKINEKKHTNKGDAIAHYHQDVIDIQKYQNKVLDDKSKKARYEASMKYWMPHKIVYHLSK